MNSGARPRSRDTMTVDKGANGNDYKAAIEGRLPRGMGVARLCDLPAEWVLHALDRVREHDDVLGDSLYEVRVVERLSHDCHLS